MNFPESLEYLYNLGNEVLAMKLGLENIRKVLNALGNPEKKYLKVQIAGTNGKGSTVAFLESICAAANINVGSTTSPHLVSITERVKIGGAEISEKDFARHATQVREISENLVAAGELETVPTYFEQVTAIALNAFAEAEIELAILETGLGGRFDATTAASAEIVAITPIDYDHQNILGETLTLIAAEKAAIIRQGVKLIVAPQKEEALQVIKDACDKQNVELINADFRTFVHSIDKNGGITVSIYTEKNSYFKIRPNLLGRHQIENACTAIAIAETLNNFDYKISYNDINNGLKTARHKGRLEFYENILFDGAHNVAGAKALAEFLDEFITQPIILIFGAMRDKSLSEIGEILFPKADVLILTEPDNPRSMKTADLLKYVPKNYEKMIFRIETVKAAIEKAREISAEKNQILITGSLYLVGEAQEILQNSF